MSNFKIFVVGYTGGTGKTLLKLIVNDSRFNEVILFGRRSVELNYGENNSKFVQKLVDFDNLDASKDLFKDNFDGGFCCLGTTRGKSGKEGFIKVDHDYTLKVAELAKEGGCKQFHLVSSSGASSKSMLLYTQIKGLVEEAIMKLQFPRLNIYRPKVLTGNREEARMGETFFKAIIKPINYISPSLLSTPFEVLCRAMIASFVLNQEKLQSNTEEEPKNSILDNNAIFKLGSVTE